MTETIREPFCPIYREARDAAPWTRATSAHAGLLFDKFAHAWRFKRDHNGNQTEPVVLEFDKGAGRSKQGANEWLNAFARKCGDPDLLIEACTRQRQLVESFGGRMVCLTNISRFVTGIGREHPLENGFAWHHSLGVPYLPGSSVKGLLRAWLREDEGELTRGDGRDWCKESERSVHWFGTQGNVGSVTFLDLLPTRPPQLGVDVMTPHYGPYYQDHQIPGDWHSPVPITFLVVEPGATWQVSVVPTGRKHLVSDDDLNRLANSLTNSLEIFGAGAKSAVGYGRFERDSAAEGQLLRDAAQRQKLRQDNAARKTRLSQLSPSLREIVERAETENWTSGQTQFLDAVERYLAEHPTPASDVIEWIRDNCLERFWKGIWHNPDAVSGKKKKPKFSVRASKLVHRLKDES